MKLDSQIINSKIAQTANLYRAVNIDNSEINENCVVGDFSRINNSKLENFVRINRQNLIYYSEIGCCSYTGNNDVIMHTKIGRFCSISWGITIGAGEHDYKRLTSHDFIYNDFYGLRPYKSEIPYDRFAKKCEIKNDVWIGANSTILRNVEIGNGAVIGANSIVTKDIPPYAIVVGNPAKIVKFRFEKDIIEQLLTLEWWNLPLNVIKENYDIFKEMDIKNSIKKLKKLLL